MTPSVVRASPTLTITVELGCAPPVVSIATSFAVIAGGAKVGRTVGVSLLKWGNELIVITSHQTQHARLLVLKAALSLEIKGMKRRGRSVYSIVRKELGFKGNKQRVYDQLVEYIQKKENEHEN